MPLFSEEQSLAAMQRLRRAFDPLGLRTRASSSRRRASAREVRGPYRMHPLEEAGLADRFEGIIEHEPGDPDT